MKASNKQPPKPEEYHDYRGCNQLYDHFRQSQSRRGVVNARCCNFLWKGIHSEGYDLRNTAGPHKTQAVAFHSGSDLSVVYRCSFEGYQDTLYAHHCRQFYRECSIIGSIDFIFGNARAVFQECNIVARRGNSGQKNTVTAQGRTALVQATGFTLQFCTIKAEEGSLAVYLGRPWKKYARVVVMESYLDGLEEDQPLGYFVIHCVRLGSQFGIY